MRTRYEVYSVFFLMIRRPPRSTLDRSSAASDVYKRQNLHRSLGDILDLSGERPTMALQSDVRAGLEQHIARQRAVARSRRVLSGIEETLQSAPWYSDEWLEGTLGGVMHEFDRATSRWRDLYLSLIHI